jgi:hypothetical protein
MMLNQDQGMDWYESAFIVMEISNLPRDSSEVRLHDCRFTILGERMRQGKRSETD